MSFSFYLGIKSTAHAYFSGIDDGDVRMNIDDSVVVSPETQFQDTTDKDERLH